MAKINHSGLAREAFSELFPGKEESRDIIVKYSAKFRGYNANVRYSSKEIVFSLSRDWLELSDELKKGLIQHLLIKVYKIPFEKTIEMDLYEKFISNLGKYAHVEEENDQELIESFNRLNKEYFEDLLERPNLVWGQDSFRKLGHYEYATNTIMISNIFKGETELIDSIMYHEMLHKKQGRRITKTGRSVHHDAKFRAEEAKYKDKDAEKKITAFIRRKRLRNVFRWW
ncbi:MAG: hypothetical protein ACP5N3_00305 [Candidatus Nanoarchaeia archaeon]